MIQAGHSLFTGNVSHARLTPRRHQFKYRMSMICLDLEQLNTAFSGRWLWSIERRNIVSFRRQDYLPGSEDNLADAARNTVQQATGTRPQGRIMLMTQPRYLGVCFNPISLYFCHDDADRLCHVIAEVHNTPWNERTPYVLTVPENSGNHISIDFDKTMHVSPFMDMNMHYRFRMAKLGETLRVTLENYREGTRIFTAGMQLQSKPLDAAACMHALVGTPLMTFKIMGAIYWQALRLWLKGVPFVAHPGVDKTNKLSTRLSNSEE